MPAQPALDAAFLLGHPLSLAVALLVVFAAFYVRATIGFGSGLISVSLLTLLFPIKEVVPVVLLLDLMGALALGAYDLREMRPRELGWLLPGSLLGVLAGAQVLRDSAAQQLTLFLGLFIIAYVLYAVLIRPERLPRIGPLWALPLGLFGGVIGSLYGGGGPPIVAYLQMRHLDKRAFRATFQAIALADNAARGLVYATFGLLDLPQAGAFMVLAPAVLAGLLLGNRLHMRIRHETFLRATLAVLFAVGLKYLVS